jgi:cytoskeletal protein RodZ
MAKNLWKSGRAARNDMRAEEDKTLPPSDLENGSEVDGVGATLRKRREEHGEDLRYVAQILRIRYPYLKAIEDGHPDDLPGPTYAVGFVRTYADHLGLDSEKLVQQFKEEAAGLQARADLHFPAPLPEGKIPSGVVLVTAVVLAAVVYGGWIYLSSREQQVAENVPELPSRISEIVTGKSDATETDGAGGGMTASAPPAASSESSSAAAPDTMPADEAPASETPAEAAPSVAMSSETPDTAPDPAADADAASEPAADESDQADAQTAGDGEESVATATPEAETDSVAAIPAPPGDSDSSESDLSPQSSVVASASEESDGASGAAAAGGDPVEEDRAPPKIYGEGNDDARIVIHAAADSWVEVRDSATDELLLTRVLFKGDKYMVPDRGGLTLLTGNAGGLRIVVDGTDVPAIGPLGAVRRNVALEPSALLSGNAARRSGGGAAPADSQTSDSGVQVQ